MSEFADCSASIQSAVQQLLTLSQSDPSTVQRSLQKVIEPNFEIVFAGAFSAGKSMLINALLGRKLLYSAEGHATGTECRIAYASEDQERVILTFSSLSEIQVQGENLCDQLELRPLEAWDESFIQAKIQACAQIVDAEGGASKSERAKQAVALQALLEGYWENRNRIHPQQSATYPMEQFNFSTLQEAASYARRGSNSAVLQRIEYFCHHDLLKDGNVLIDTPGIDAPVQEDAQRTYRKIADPDTSAVICVLKAAETGELTTEETELLETIRENPSIRDRVFYVFNRVDKAWYNSDLRGRLDHLIQSQFQDSHRIFKTSGLLGFYGSQIRHCTAGDRFGLDSIFAEDGKSAESTPLFVTEFNNYCGSGRLIGSVFRPEIRGYEHPHENYVRILADYGTPLIDYLIKDSGVEDFRGAIAHYLADEKRPQLLSNLADDLQPLCASLRKKLIEQYQALEAQPKTVSAIQEQELRQLNQDLLEVSQDFKCHVETELNQIIGTNSNEAFEKDFRKLQGRMVKRLDELLTAFSVAEVHQQAQASHKRNSVVPLLGILAEAFYYLSNGLEVVLTETSETIVRNFFQYLGQQIEAQDYFRRLLRLTGEDAGIETQLRQLEIQVCHAIHNEAVTECDRYVRERPEFYAEGSVSIFQLRQTLQQSCRGFDHQAMVEAEPAIRQLLKLDFEQKVGETVMRTFRHTVNQALNHHLLTGTDHMVSGILQQYDHARHYLAQVLEKEASEQIALNQQKQAEVREKIEVFNQGIAGVNQNLELANLDRQKLALILESDLDLLPQQDRSPSFELAEIIADDSEESSEVNAPIALTL